MHIITDGVNVGVGKFRISKSHNSLSAKEKPSGTFDL